MYGRFDVPSGFERRFDMTRFKQFNQQSGRKPKINTREERKRISLVEKPSITLDKIYEHAARNQPPKTPFCPNQLPPTTPFGDHYSSQEQEQQHEGDDPFNNLFTAATTLTSTPNAEGDFWMPPKTPKIMSTDHTMSFELCELLSSSLLKLNNMYTVESRDIWANKIYESHWTFMPNKFFLLQMMNWMSSSLSPATLDLTTFIQGQDLPNPDTTVVFPTFVLDEDFLDEYHQPDKMTNFEILHYTACCVEYLKEQKSAPTTTTNTTMDEWVFQFFIFGSLTFPNAQTLAQYQDLLVNVVENQQVNRYIFSGGMIRSQLMRLDTFLDEQHMTYLGRMLTTLFQFVDKVSDWFAFFEQFENVIVFQQHAPILFDTFPDLLPWKPKIEALTCEQFTMPKNQIKEGIYESTIRLDEEYAYVKWVGCPLPIQIPRQRYDMFMS